MGHQVSIKVEEDYWEWYFVNDQAWLETEDPLGRSIKAATAINPVTFRDEILSSTLEVVTRENRSPGMCHMKHQGMLLQPADDVTPSAFHTLWHISFIFVGSYLCNYLQGVGKEVLQSHYFIAHEMGILPAWLATPWFFATLLSAILSQKEFRDERF